MPLRLVMPNSEMKPTSEATDGDDAADDGERDVDHHLQSGARMAQRHLQSQINRHEREQRKRQNQAARRLLRLELPAVLHEVARRHLNALPDLGFDILHDRTQIAARDVGADHDAALHVLAHHGA